MKKKIQKNRLDLRTPTGRRQNSWLFTSMAEELYSGLPEWRSTNLNGEEQLQIVLRVRLEPGTGLRISSPAC